MFSSIKRLFSRLFAVRDGEDREENYLAIRSRIEAEIREGKTTADEALFDALRSGTLTANEFNGLRSYLVDRGLFEFANPAEVDANRDRIEELTDLAVDLDLIDESDAEALRGEHKSS